MKEKSLVRNQRILEAAHALFLENGLRGTTMEAIARRAGTAKPTLYAYYPDKEHVFRAVIAGVIADMKQIVETALAQEGQPEERIAGALSAKYAYVTELLSGSPHAQELMTDKLLHAGEEFEALHDWLEQKIATTLKNTGHANAKTLAQLLVACVDGLHRSANDIQALNEQISYVAQKLLSS